MRIEIWKKTQYRDYDVSNFGRVRSRHSRLAKNYLLKQRVVHGGYKAVWITQDRIEYNKKVHRLVATAFIENPNCYPQVNHIDGDKTNNTVENLEWCNGSQNQLHAYHILGNGGGASGEQHWNRKLDWNKISQIRKMSSELGMTNIQIAKIFGVHRRTISDVINFKTWKHEDIL